MCDAPWSKAGNSTPNDYRIRSLINRHIRPEKVRTPGLALVRTVLENPGMGTSPGRKHLRNHWVLGAVPHHELPGNEMPRAPEQPAKVSAPLADYIFRSAPSMFCPVPIPLAARGGSL